MNRCTTVPSTVLLLAERGNALDSATLLLAREGYRVLRCNRSDDALAVLGRERAQVLILNEEILETGGAELIRRLRAAAPMLAIIARSKTADPRTRGRLVDDLGVDGVQRDDDEPARLVELVSCLIARTRRTEEAVAEHELRTLLLTKLCHGLRTSMHVIHGYTQILRADRRAAGNEDVLTRLSSASEGALDLLRRHLGNAPVELVPPPSRPSSSEGLVNVDDLIRSVCAEAADQAGPRAARVRSAVPWASAFIRTDSEKLRSILTDLTVASARSVREGEIQVAVEFGAEQTHFALRYRNGSAYEEEQGGDLAAVPPPAFYPVTESSGRVLGIEVAVRLSATLGASLATARTDAGGAIFSLRIPAAAVMQPEYRSVTVH